MFETHVSFEYRLPSPLKAPDTQQWVAMALNVEAPWFVLVSRIVLDAEAGIEGRRTTVLADEPSLRQVLSGPSAKSLLTLQCMLPGEGKRRDVWRMERVREVWQPADAEMRQGALLVFQFWDSATWHATGRGCAVAAAVPGRQLLVRFEGH